MPSDKNKKTWKYSTSSPTKTDASHLEQSSESESIEENSSHGCEHCQVLQKQNEELKSSYEKMQKTAQYLKADEQNNMRRHNEAMKYAGVNIISSFLVLLDSAEAAHAETTQKDVSTAKEGEKNIVELMHTIFEKLGVVTIDPVIAEVFDPNLHSAVATEAPVDADQANNTIIRVLRKGYQLHDRVLRPAMVVVSHVEE